MSTPAAGPVVITIVRKPNGSIEPQGGIRTRVRTGAAIEFRAGGGATDVAVHFDRSPFGDRPEDKVNLRRGVVKRRFDPANASNNIYSYRCELELDGQRFEWPAKGRQGPGPVGGEIEIVG